MTSPSWSIATVPNGAPGCANCALAFVYLGPGHPRHLGAGRRHRSRQGRCRRRSSDISPGSPPSAIAAHAPITSNAAGSSERGSTPTKYPAASPSQAHTPLLEPAADPPPCSPYSPPSPNLSRRCTSSHPRPLYPSQAQPQCRLTLSIYSTNDLSLALTLNIFFDILLFQTPRATQSRYILYAGARQRRRPPTPRSPTARIRRRSALCIARIIPGEPP
jgi:hypothetical protein